MSVRKVNMSKGLRPTKFLNSLMKKANGLTSILSPFSFLKYRINLSSDMILTKDSGLLLEGPICKSGHAPLNQFLAKLQQVDFEEPCGPISPIYSVGYISMSPCI